jgi:hypothetical protein
MVPRFIVMNMLSGVHFFEGLLHTEFILGVFSRGSQESLHALLLLERNYHLMGGSLAPYGRNLRHLLENTKKKKKKFN